MLPTIIKQMGVRQLQLIETGSYQPMFYRPYTLNTDGGVLNSLTERINQNPATVGGCLLAGVASQALLPSPDAHAPILMPNGWQERRIRFMLVVDFETTTGLKGTYWIQGYTAYHGVSQQGHMDPTMMLIANSFTYTNLQSMMTPLGMQQNEIIMDSAQILTAPSGDIYAQNNNIYSMRPEDIFGGMQVAAAMQASPDVRMKDTRSIINYRPYLSARKHNIPTDYLGNIFNNYFTGKQFIGFGAGDTDIVSQAFNGSRDKSINENLFFQYLAQNKMGGQVNQFTIKDLERLDPGIGSKTVFIRLSQIMQMNSALPTPSTDNASTWTGQDLTTQMATMLAESVPSIMLQSLLSVVSFRATNCDLGGQNNIVFTSVRSISKVDAKTLTNLFQQKFEKHIVPDLTMNGMMPYMLEMNCDVSGDTWITLQIADYPSVTFTVPSFCDSLFSPVVTNSQQHLESTTVQMDSMLNYISDEVLSNKPSMLDVMSNAPF